MVLSAFVHRIGGFALLLGLSGCAQGLEGDTGLIPLISVREEAEIGRAQHPRMLVKFGGAYDDKPLDAYIGNLTTNLARRAGIPGVRKVTVLNTPGVNAFALPGGYIYVTRGLLALANDEAELAMVISHEIGHVAARHPAKRIARVANAQLLDNPIGRLFTIGPARMINSLGSEGYVALYSRLQEFEADALGIRVGADAGYLPAASTSFLESMGRDQDLRNAGLNRNQSRNGGDYMSAHPPTPDRLGKAQQVVASLPATGERRRDAYLAKIDGLVFGDSRENGVVRGREFLQPVLGFAFKVPPGFAIQNRPNAIIALGPNKSIILFDGALVDDTMPIADYLVRDWAENLTLSGVQKFRFNNLEAASGYASIGDREVRLVAIRQDAERVYRFIIMDQKGALAGFGGKYLKFVKSFRQLSLSEAKAIRPLRIRIRTVRPGDTAESLSARMPFAKRKAERFRVLNGLDRGEQPRVGQRVKLVVG